MPGPGSSWAAAVADGWVPGKTLFPVEVAADSVVYSCAVLSIPSNAVCEAPTEMQFLHVAGWPTVASVDAVPALPAAKTTRKSGLL